MACVTANMLLWLSDPFKRERNVKAHGARLLDKIQFDRRHLDPADERKESAGLPNRRFLLFGWVFFSPLNVSNSGAHLVWSQKPGTRWGFHHPPLIPHNRNV